MTMYQFEELCGYWAEHPPVHILVAGFVGYKPSVRPSFEDFFTAPEAVSRAMGIPGIAVGNPLEGLPEPTFDIDALMRTRPN